VPQAEVEDMNAILESHVVYQRLIGRDIRGVSRKAEQSGKASFFSAVSSELQARVTPTPQRTASTSLTPHNSHAIAIAA
jgi:hypothetical protein